MSWFWFALATPFLYCIAVYIDKFVLSQKHSDPLIVTLLSGSVMGALALAIKIFIGVHPLDLLQIIILLVSGALLFFYILPYLKALQIDDATQVVPLMQLAPVYVLVFSSMFLKEPLTYTQLLGFLLILVSSLVLSTDKLSLKIFQLRKSFWLMAIAMLMYAGIGLLFRYVVREQDLWTTIFYQNLGAFLSSLFFSFYLMNKPHFKNNLLKHRPVFIFITISNLAAALGILSQSIALSTASTPKVYIIEGSQPLIMLVIAVISSIWFPKIMKEDLARDTLGRKIFLSLIIFIGLLLIRS
jgi:uncharacterized membrane protein